MVQGRLQSGLIASIRAGHFEIISGLSEDQGGHDEGPNPHEILEAALTACTVLTCQLYAARKKWPLLSTNVQVQIVKESKEQTAFNLAIEFAGDLTQEQKERLFEIAGKCPIHKLLLSKIEISAELL